MNSKFTSTLTSLCLSTLSVVTFSTKSTLFTTCAPEIFRNALDRICGANQFNNLDVGEPVFEMLGLKQPTPRALPGAVIGTIPHPG